MSEKLDKLKSLLGEVIDIGHASAVLSWDQQVNMPPGGNEARGQQLATLGQIAQEKFITDEVGALLEDLKREFAGADPDSDEASLIRVVSRDYDKAKRVPPSFVAERAKVSSKAFDAWVEARKKSDFSIFIPHLEKVVDLMKKYISFFPPAAHPYDTLLEDYEAGMTTADVKAIFEPLRTKQVELIKAIADSKQVKFDFLHKKYNEAKLIDFGVDVVTKYGYDWNRGRQDKAPHPFATTFSINDVRITTRFVPEIPFSTLFGTFHEAGHGMYEQGVNPAYERTSLMGGTSLGVHESQSRFWENIIGRSLPFWEHFYPALKKKFPSQLNGVGVKAFYKAINKVQPTFIRVEADEATYNLHIMLRLELEIAMIEGKVALKDLPEMWNTKMKEYLGITPPNDARGVLQDVHWSHGYMGYFSTYALGNLISAQFLEVMRKDIRNMDDLIRKGSFGEILGWLREKMHRHGQKYEPQTLVQMITGSKITSEPYVRYLKEKYTDIYGL